MVLYSLLKGKINNTEGNKESTVDTVGDYKIEFVTSLPNSRNANTIYFVLREPIRDGIFADKIIVGGKGIQCIAYGDVMLGMGVLNGNTFFDGYDFLTKHNKGMSFDTQRTYLCISKDTPLIGKNSHTPKNN
jgi:hypothetical protein